MKTRAGQFGIWLSLVVAFVFQTQAGTLYVDANSINATPPYAGWDTAAITIQSAINAANTGDLILVTNGIYATDGRTVYGSLSNRVAVYKTLTIQSINGPSNTFIVGSQTSPVRCVYLTNNAVLIGFTLTNGTTGNNQFEGDPHQLNGGGLWCEPNGGSVISNCVLTANSSFQFGGGAYYGTLLRCTLRNNNGGDDGGGAYGCNLSNCTVYSNTVGGGAYSGPIGGGAAQSVLNGCTLFANKAFNGGGAAGSTLADCLILTNIALGFLSNGGSGGGVSGCGLNRCTLSANSASLNGGGADSSSLTNCLLAGNSASKKGGGASGGILVNCTVVNNNATVAGGGVANATATNCVVYLNTSPSGSNYNNTTFQFSCTAPPPSDNGNLAADPMLVDPVSGNFRLKSNSPCINSGNRSIFAGLTDLDGNARVTGNTVDIGAYEFQSPASILSYAWLQQYNLPIDGSADYADNDGTGMNNWQKWIAGLNPTNPASVLALMPPTVTNNATGLVVRWQSVNTRTYYLQRATNITAPAAFSTIQSNLTGQAGTTSYTDVSATNGGPYFYRIGVQ